MLDNKEYNSDLKEGIDYHLSKEGYRIMTEIFLKTEAIVVETVVKTVHIFQRQTKETQTCADEITKPLTNEWEELRIVFMGTPEFAVASLKALIENGYNVAGVVTAPDRYAGRGQKLHQ